MMLRDLLDTSATISLLKNVWGGFYCIQQMVVKIYKESRSYRFIQESWSKTILCFRYSFLTKIMRAIKKDSPEILENSRFVLWLVQLYINWKKRLIDFLETSMFSRLTEKIKENCLLLPVKTASTVIVAVILINMVFFVLFHKEITVFGWIMRILLFGIAIKGLSCHVKWQDLKSTSFITRKICNENQDIKSYNAA